MAKFLKLPNFFGKAEEIWYYNPKCQYDNLEYYRHVKKINGHSVLSLDGENDYVVINYDNESGWFPQVGSTFFLKFMLPENSVLYSKAFGIFGSGSGVDLNNQHDFWGLAVAYSEATHGYNFKLTISDTKQIKDIDFIGCTFSPVDFPAGKVCTIALTQTSTEAKLYINGTLRGTIGLPFVPETKAIYKNIYVGQYGRTSEYQQGMPMYLLETGCWERPIELRDIIDLCDKNLVTNQGVSSKSKRIKIESGQLYYDGYIHSIDETSMYIDGVGKETIYLVISEKIVTEAEDPELNDNSSNTYNLGKPGMHRIKYEYSYGINIDTASLPEGSNAIKYLEFEDGVKTFSLAENAEEDEIVENTSSTDIVSKAGGKKAKTSTSSAENSDLLAKYFFEALGNFIFSGLSVSVSDKDYSNYQISVGNGVYYLNGIRYELDSNVNLDVAKSSSINTVFNEQFEAKAGTPIAFSQQPVAAKYVDNGVMVSGIVRALVPAVQSHYRIDIRRTDPNGQDLLDLSAIKVLNVYKGSSYEEATVRYTPCSTMDGNDGDYFFYNGYIKWSPYATNKPAASSSMLETIYVDYVKMEYCEEGYDKDFFVIKGDRWVSEAIEFRGKNITHTLRFNMENLVDAKAIVNGGVSYQLSSGHFNFSDNTFVMPTDLDGLLQIGDTINITYSYSSNTTITPQWYIVFNGENKNIDTTTPGIMDYKYYLTDMYTLAIDPDNSFRLYRGNPGYRGNATKAAIPESSLPVADIVIDPDNANYCAITTYGVYRVQVSDLRNLIKKVNNLENNIALSELEKSGEAKSSLENLKGMYVDALSTYSRIDASRSDAYINLIAERLYSGMEQQTFQLELANSNHTTGREVYYPVSNYQTTIVDSQHTYTGDESVNKISQSVVGPQVEVYNDFSYAQENVNNTSKNILLATKLCPYTLIPGNSEISVYNNSFSGTPDSSNSRSDLLKNALDKYNLFFTEGNISTTIANRTVIISGKGFNSNETNLTISVGGQFIDPAYYQAVFPNAGTSDIISISENGFIKNIRISPVSFASGWSVSELNNITCNDKGEFIIVLSIPSTLNILTGMQDILVNRLADIDNPIKIKANFNGVVDSLKNVINTGSRGNTTFYDNLKYSYNYVPAVIQPISSITASLTGINLYFTYIDYTVPMLVDIYELDGTNVKKVLYRKYIKNRDDFAKINGNCYSINFDYPVNIINTKKYAIGICTENASIRSLITEIGKPSKDADTANIVVSKVKAMYSVISANGDNSFNISNDGKKGLVYDLLAVDNSTSIKNSQGYIESTMLFSALHFDKEQDSFYLCCDTDPTSGYDRKITFEYSIDDSDILDENKTWTKIIPYSLVKPGKFSYLTLRAITASGNNNYLLSLPQYPIIHSFRFKEESNYFSRYFETGIDENSGDTDVNIYLNTDYRIGSDYSVYVSPDLGITWRECQENVTAINAQTTDMLIREELFKYECRLTPPVITSHELIAPKSGEYAGEDVFIAGSTVSYLVTLLDSNGTPNEVYNIDAEDHQAKVYTLNITETGQKVKLHINIDPTAKGFRVYRAINGSSVFSQVYSSIAASTIPTGITIDPAQIPVLNNAEFPESGILKINNELIKYAGKEGTGILNVEQRAFYSTTIGTLHSGDEVALYDYCQEHENILDGQIPKVYAGKPYFDFIDDLHSHPAYADRVAVSDDRRNSNMTVSYPAYLGIQIKFTNSDTVTDSSSVWNMICNIEKP